MKGLNEMKIKVSVPSDPVCTIKLEIAEAKALYCGLTGDARVVCNYPPQELTTAFAEALRQELGIPEMGTLFDEHSQIV